MELWKQAGFFFGEETFEEEMNTKGKKFRDEHYREGCFPGCDFRSIHYVYVKNKNERAAVVISHGFCEFISKYDELVYYFYQLGYSVYFIEHRGHGYSFRYVPDELDRVHLEDFRDYVEDLKCFMDLIVTKESPQVPKLLFAHSMGGAIGARFLELYPGYFKAAVLSSPMMEMEKGKFPTWLVCVLTAWMRLIGKGKKYVPGSHGFDGQYDFEGSSMLSESRYRYVFHMREQVPEYTMYGATYGWTGACMKAERQIRRDAHKVELPVLLITAGMDAKVRFGGQKYFAEAAKQTTLVSYPNSKHEIFNALQGDREKYFAEVFAFLEQYAAVN